MNASDGSMSDKVVLVTGATSGIGKQTALALAGMGATTIVAGRDREKTAATVQEVKAATGNARVQVLLADLSAQADVRGLATEFRESHDRLDVLVNNAGGGFAHYTESVDGFEMTWALNYLSAFLLTNLLLEELRAAPAARVVNVGSASHRGSKIDFDDPNLRRRYSSNRAYGQSKLADVVFAYELSRRMARANTSVTANVADPGPVATNLFKSENMTSTKSPLLKIGFRVHGAIASPPEKGAETVVYLASSPEVDGVTGENWSKKRVAATSAASRSETAARRLWEMSERMTGLAPSGTRGADHRGEKRA